MQKIFDASERLFFNILIICLISCIYFNIFPKNTITITIGLIFCIFYFGINFYTGYFNNLSIREAIIVGSIGCSIGLFLGFFAIYTKFVLDSPNIAIWMIMPYFSPTISLLNVSATKITFAYPFIIMILNIFLVIMGSISKKIMNKLS